MKVGSPDKFSVVGFGMPSMDLNILLTETNQMEGGGRGQNAARGRCPLVSFAVAAAVRRRAHSCNSMTNP